MKKYKINKEKLQKRLPIAIGLILIIIALAVFPNTLSRYASSGVSGTNINIAYSLLDIAQMENGTMVDNVKLPEVNPDGNYNDFVFQVRNYKEVEENGSTYNKIINVKMRYYVELTVTTNLPMTYYFEVHTHDNKNYTSTPVTPYNSTAGPCSDTAGENITIENNVISSTGGTQIQADWNQTNVEAVDYIKNKPTIPDMANYYTKQEIDNKFSEVETTLSQI